MDVDRQGRETRCVPAGDLQKKGRHGEWEWDRAIDTISNTLIERPEREIEAERYIHIESKSVVYRRGQITKGNYDRG